MVKEEKSPTKCKESLAEYFEKIYGRKPTKKELEVFEEYVTLIKEGR